MNEYSSNTSKYCVAEVDLKYTKEIHELHNNYTLAPDKMEIKAKMLLKYQAIIADLFNIPIGNVKKLVTNVFDKEKYQSQWLKTYVEFNTQKTIETEKNGDKDEKGLYKLINNAF